MLSRTREWRSTSVREDAACRADAEGLPDLAAALRGRNVTGFRKRDFFALCRFWGYRSNIWTPVGRSLGAETQHSPFVRPTPPRVPDAAVALILRDIGPAFAAFQHYNRLPSLAAAMASEPGAPLATMDVQARVARACTPAPRACITRLTRPAFAALHLRRRCAGCASWEQTCLRR